VNEDAYSSDDAADVEWRESEGAHVRGWGVIVCEPYGLSQQQLQQQQHCM